MLSRRFGSWAEWLTFKVPGIGRGSSGLAGLAVFGAVENAGGLDNSNIEFRIEYHGYTAGSTVFPSGASNL